METKWDTYGSKFSEKLESVAEQVCEQLGMKKSELARLALIEYLKSLSVLSARVKEYSR